MSEIEKHQVLVKKLTVENDFLRKENEALQTVVKVYQSHLETVVIAVGQKKRSSGNYSSSKLAFVTGIRAPEATVKNFCRRVRK
jgi:hypothetical protein